MDASAALLSVPDGSIELVVNSGADREEAVPIAATAAGIDPFVRVAQNEASKLRLKFWREEESFVNNRIERKEQRLQSAKHEIYQLLGIYFVFQGVILTALTQAITHIRASWRWIPFVLSGLGSLATVSALVYKLRNCSDLEQQIRDEKRRSRALYWACDDLIKSAQFDPTSVEFQPHLRPENREQISIASLLSTGGFLVLILLIFSTIMGIACWLIK